MPTKVIKKKNVESAKKKDTIWKVVIGIGVVLGVFGGFYKIDSVYVRSEYHALCMAETKQNLSEVQKQISVQRAYDEVFFWQRTEVELMKASAAHPNDKALKAQLEEVQKNKKEADDRLRKVRQ